MNRYRYRVTLAPTAGLCVEFYVQYDMTIFNMTMSLLTLCLSSWAATNKYYVAPTYFQIEFGIYRALHQTCRATCSFAGERIALYRILILKFVVSFNVITSRCQEINFEINSTTAFAAKSAEANTFPCQKCSRWNTDWSGDVARTPTFTKASERCWSIGIMIPSGAQGTWKGFLTRRSRDTFLSCQMMKN